MQLCACFCPRTVSDPGLVSDDEQAVAGKAEFLTAQPSDTQEGCCTASITLTTADKGAKSHVNTYAPQSSHCYVKVQLVGEEHDEEDLVRLQLALVDKYTNPADQATAAYAAAGSVQKQQQAHGTRCPNSGTIASARQIKVAVITADAVSDSSSNNYASQPASKSITSAAARLEQEPHTDADVRQIAAGAVEAEPNEYFEQHRQSEEGITVSARNEAVATEKAAAAEFGVQAVHSNRASDTSDAADHAETLQGCASTPCLWERMLLAPKLQQLLLETSTSNAAAVEMQATANSADRHDEQLRPDLHDGAAATGQEGLQEVVPVRAAAGTVEHHVRPSVLPPSEDGSVSSEQFLLRSFRSSSAASKTGSMQLTDDACLMPAVELSEPGAVLLSLSDARSASAGGLLEPCLSISPWRSSRLSSPGSSFKRRAAQSRSLDFGQLSVRGSEDGSGSRLQGRGQQTTLTDKLLLQLADAAVAALTQDRQVEGLLRADCSSRRNTTAGCRRHSAVATSAGSTGSSSTGSGLAYKRHAQSANGAVLEALPVIHELMSVQQQQQQQLRRSSSNGAPGRNCMHASVPALFRTSSGCSIGGGQGEVLSAAHKARLLRQVSAALAAGISLDDLLQQCEDAAGSSYSSRAVTRQLLVQQQGLWGTWSTPRGYSKVHADSRRRSSSNDRCGIGSCPVNSSSKQGSSGDTTAAGSVLSLSREPPVAIAAATSKRQQQQAVQRSWGGTVQLAAGSATETQQLQQQSSGELLPPGRAWQSLEEQWELLRHQWQRQQQHAAHGELQAMSAAAGIRLSRSSTWDSYIASEDGYSAAEGWSNKTSLAGDLEQYEPDNKPASALLPEGFCTYANELCEEAHDSAGWQEGSTYVPTDDAEASQILSRIAAERLQSGMPAGSSTSCNPLFSNCNQQPQQCLTVDCAQPPTNNSTAAAATDTHVAHSSAVEPAAVPAARSRACGCKRRDSGVFSSYTAAAAAAAAAAATASAQTSAAPRVSTRVHYCPACNPDGACGVAGRVVKSADYGAGQLAALRNSITESSSNTTRVSSALATAGSAAVDPQLQQITVAAATDKSCQGLSYAAVPTGQGQAAAVTAAAASESPHCSQYSTAVSKRVARIVASLDTNGSSSNSRQGEANSTLTTAAGVAKLQPTEHEAVQSGCTKAGADVLKQPAEASAGQHAQVMQQPEQQPIPIDSPRSVAALIAAAESKAKLASNGSPRHGCGKSPRWNTAQEGKCMPGSVRSKQASSQPNTSSSSRSSAVQASASPNASPRCSIVKSPRVHVWAASNSSNSVPDRALSKGAALLAAAGCELTSADQQLTATTSCCRSPSISSETLKTATVACGSKDHGSINTAASPAVLTDEASTTAAADSTCSSGRSPQVMKQVRKSTAAAVLSGSAAAVTSPPGKGNSSSSGSSSSYTARQTRASSASHAVSTSQRDKDSSSTQLNRQARASSASAAVPSAAVTSPHVSSISSSQHNTRQLRTSSAVSPTAATAAASADGANSDSSSMQPIKQSRTSSVSSTAPLSAAAAAVASPRYECRSSSATPQLSKQARTSGVSAATPALDANTKQQQQQQPPWSSSQKKAASPPVQAAARRVKELAQQIRNANAAAVAKRHETSAVKGADAGKGGDSSVRTESPRSSTAVTLSNRPRVNRIPAGLDVDVSAAEDSQTSSGLTVAARNCAAGAAANSTSVDAASKRSPTKCIAGGASRDTGSNNSTAEQTHSLHTSTKNAPAAAVAADAALVSSGSMQESLMFPVADRFTLLTQAGRFGNADSSAAACPAALQTVDAAAAAAEIAEQLDRSQQQQLAIAAGQHATSAGVSQSSSCKPPGNASTHRAGMHHTADSNSSNVSKSAARSSSSRSSSCSPVRSARTSSAARGVPLQQGRKVSAAATPAAPVEMPAISRSPAKQRSSSASPTARKRWETVEPAVKHGLKCKQPGGTGSGVAAAAAGDSGSIDVRDINCAASNVASLVQPLNNSSSDGNALASDKCGVLLNSSSGANEGARCSGRSSPNRSLLHSIHWADDVVASVETFNAHDPPARHKHSSNSKAGQDSSKAAAGATPPWLLKQRGQGVDITVAAPKVAQQQQTHVRQDISVAQQSGCQRAEEPQQAPAESAVESEQEIEPAAAAALLAELLQQQQQPVELGDAIRKQQPSNCASQQSHQATTAESGTDIAQHIAHPAAPAACGTAEAVGRVLAHANTSVNAPSPRLASVFEDAESHHWEQRLLHTTPVGLSPRDGLPAALYTTRTDAYEPESAAVTAYSSSNGSALTTGAAAAGAVADGLTGILALVKQLQGNLAGLESDMHSLHGVLHRPSSRAASSARSELLSDFDASAFGGRRRSGVNSTRHSRCDTADSIPWKSPRGNIGDITVSVAGISGHGHNGASSSVGLNTPGADDTAPMTPFSIYTSITGATNEVKGRRRMTSGRTVSDVERWVGSQLVAAAAANEQMQMDVMEGAAGQPSQEGSITLGGAVLKQDDDEGVDSAVPASVGVFPAS